MHHLFEDYFMQTEESIHELIVQLFSGEAGKEEKSKLEVWLNKEPGNRKLFSDLKEIWLSSGVENNPDGYDSERAIRDFRRRISFQEGNAPRRKFPVKLMQYAAIVILALMLPATYYFAKHSGTTADSMTTIACAAGDKTTVVLPDSSRVFLNSGSELVFNNNFKSGSREVRLNGEAYFVVKKDPRHPFNVRTSHLRVQVLGTEFNLAAYSDEAQITTTLVTGSVEIKSGNESVRIEPNQKAIFDKAAGAIRVEGLKDVAQETQWKDGRFVFRNRSLAEMELQLERWFDVEIEFADEQVKDRRFTGTVEHESILEVISYFGRSNYVGYKINANQITFYSKLPMN